MEISLVGDFTEMKLIISMKGYCLGDSDIHYNDVTDE